MGIPGHLANLATNYALWKMSPILGAGHMLWWMGHTTLSQLARNQRLQQILAEAGRRPASTGAAVGQALQYVDPSALPDPYSSIPVPGGGVTP